MLTQELTGEGMRDESRASWISVSLRWPGLTDAKTQAMGIESKRFHIIRGRTRVYFYKKSGGCIREISFLFPSHGLKMNRSSETSDIPRAHDDTFAHSSFPTSLL
jgi:hypothetical protein